MTSGRPRPARMDRLTSCLFGSGRQRAGDERPAEQERAELVHLTAGAEAGGRREECECRDEPAEDRAECAESYCVRGRRGSEEDGADEVGEPRRSRVLERTLAEARLDELEVCDAGDAEAAAEGQPDEQLSGEDHEQPPPAGRNRERGEQTDGRLVEPRRSRVDDVEIPVGVGQQSLHFGKYYE